MCLLFTIQAGSGPKPAQHPTPKRRPVQLARAEPRPSSARRPRVARQLAAWPPSPLPSRPVPHTGSASPSAAWPKSAATLCNALGLGDGRAPSRARRPSHSLSLPVPPLRGARAGAPSPFSRARAVAVHTPAARPRRQSCAPGHQLSPTCCLVAVQWRLGDRFHSLGKTEEPSLARSLSRICGALGFYPELPTPKFHLFFSPLPVRRGFLVALCGK